MDDTLMKWVAKGWDEDDLVGPDNFANTVYAKWPGVLCTCARPYFRKTGPDAWEMGLWYVYDSLPTVAGYGAEVLPEAGWVGDLYGSLFGASPYHTWAEFQALVATHNATTPVPPGIRMGVAWGMLMSWPLFGPGMSRGPFYFDITDGNVATACAGGPVAVEWAPYSSTTGPIVFGSGVGSDLSTTGIGYTKYAAAFIPGGPPLPDAYASTMFVMRVSYVNNGALDASVTTGLSTVVRWVCSPGTLVHDAIVANDTAAYEFPGPIGTSLFLPGVLEAPRLPDSDLSLTTPVHSGPAWYDSAGCAPTRGFYSQTGCCA
jgi:hypothetical protein